MPMAMILIVVLGLVTVGLLRHGEWNGILDSHHDVDTKLFVSANSGWEMIRSLMHYESPSQFRDYATTDPVVPPEMYTGSDIIINDAVITWNIEEYGPALDQLILEVTATKGDDSLTVRQRVRLPDKAEYSFTYNNMDSGYLGSPQHWYGSVYWYSPSGNVLPFLAHQTFHGKLTSGVFDTQNDDHHFEDEEGSTITDPVELSFRHKQLELGDPGFDRFDHGIDLDKRFSSDPLDLGYPTIATYKFDGAPLPTDVELFYVPNGEIWWRPIGGNQSEWTVLGSQNNAIIYVKGNAWIRGVITGTTTLAVEQDVVINGNVRRANDDYAALGIVAKDDVYWENRQVFNSGLNDQIVDVFSNDGGGSYGTLSSNYRTNSGYPADVDTSVGSKRFIADPVLDSSNPDHLQLMTDYPEYDWDLWNGQFAGQVPPNTVLELSVFAGDTMGPAVTFHLMNSIDSSSDETFFRKYHKNHGSTSWRSGGLYAISGFWYDYVENWDTATYADHPNAKMVRPPAFVQLEEGIPAPVFGTYELVR